MELRKLRGNVVGTSEQYSAVGFLQHRRVVVAVTGGVHAEADALERRDRLPLAVSNTKAVIGDALGLVGDQLVAEERWLAELPGWQCVQQDGVWQLQKSFPFRQYQPGLAFVNQVADLAEQEQHHPAMLIEWGLVNVRWWTHSIGDLHLNDFIMAAKTQALIDAKNV